MKIIFTIIITSIVVLFALQNFDHVTVYFFTSKPVSIRLFFIIIFSGVIGWLTRYIVAIQREEEFKKRFKMLLTEYKRLKAGLPDDNDDDF
ncbi:Magnetosome protein MamL [Candidatus Desulfarcum epimagneticum]|uniref:Magnetosome protein MamL n=1 Tax=uncultured Desulfobacteraceae bacterium TaxID=218296 RepID=A0A484HLH5_9BACT|nr:Magnetosome protein MamL [uncultured Desulfobacteraceae bacterium]